MRDPGAAKPRLLLLGTGARLRALNAAKKTRDDRILEDRRRALPAGDSA
jgi:hypothetical protein